LESIGSFLKRRREELELTLEEIAQSTKINKKYLEAIEADRFDLLPQRVYGKVFVTAYARRLGLTPEELDHKLEIIEETSVWRLEKPGSKKHPKTLDFVFVGAGVVLGVAVLLILILKPEQNKKNDFEEASLRAIQNLPLEPAQSGSENGWEGMLGDSLLLKIEASGKSSALVLSGSDTLFEGVLKNGQALTWKSLVGFTVKVDRPKEVKVYINGWALKDEYDKDMSRLGLEISPQTYRELVKTQSN
jgi:transcriptional regulator with XRE-family HTH domain